MKTESAFIKRCLIAATELGMRLGRNSKGGGVVGDFTDWHATSTKKGPMQIATTTNARFLLFGLLFPGAKGGESDLIGWRTLRITAEMVGQRIAQFTAWEAKTPGVRATPEQRNFLAQVRKAGGYGAVVRESADGKLQIDEGREAAEVSDVEA